LLQNGILHFAFKRSRNRQKSCYKVKIYTDEKLTFLEVAWHLKG